MEKRTPFSVVFTGPESTGKTTLASLLAADTGWPLVSEFAREWLENKNQYTESDVYRMALGQYALLEQKYSTDAIALIADTDLLTYRIWLMVRFGHVAQWLIDLHHRQRPSMYLLCATDLQWIADPHRENPRDREVLFDEYHSLLIREHLPFTIIRGTGEARYAAVVENIPPCHF